MFERRHKNRGATPRRHHCLAETQVFGGHRGVGQKLVFVDKAHRHRLPAQTQLLHADALPFGVLLVQVIANLSRARFVGEGRVERSIAQGVDGQRACGAISRARGTTHAQLGMRRHRIAVFVFFQHVTGAKRNAQTAFHTTLRRMRHAIAHRVAFAAFFVPVLNLLLDLFHDSLSYV